MVTKGVLRNERGFTLIEIIAVLVILGILAAVAVPRYLDMAKEAKQKAAQGQVAEIKASLNLAYARAFIKTGAAPKSIEDVITEAGWKAGENFTLGTPPDDWSCNVAGTGEIKVNSRGGDDSYTATGNWALPQ